MSETGASVADGFWAGGWRLSKRSMEVAPSDLPRKIDERQIWWIRKPRGPRMNVRTAMILWALAIPVLAGTWLWLVRSGAEAWPFNRPAGSPPPSWAEVLFRYELVFAGLLAYVTLRSLPVWGRYRRSALHDAMQIGRLLSVGRFREAAEHLHR